MKYKWISLLAVVALIIAAWTAHHIEPGKNRYHQHLEAAEKAPCTDHGDDVFCTHLPLMNIVTDAPMPEPHLYDENGTILRDKNGVSLKNSEMVGATVQYFDNEVTNNHLTDTSAVEARALIRIRGQTSRHFDKTGYLLKFKEKDMITNLDVSLSGMTEDSDWVLHGPFLDKTLIRNYLCYNLAGEIMDYAPNVRFCEMFLNGEYMGVYLIVEKIEYNKYGRINVTKTDPEFDTTAYIVLADRGTTDYARRLVPFGTYSYNTMGLGAKGGQLEVVYPGKTLTPGQIEFIENDLSKFERALFSYDYDDEPKGYSQYIDIDSFVDYFLINEFTLNYDAVVFSTYLYKDIGGKLKLCVWDFNSAFDYYEYSVVSPETFKLHSVMWYKGLFRDERFVKSVENRYRALRKTYFNEDYLFKYIDDTVAYLGEAIDRNYKKWGYSFSYASDILVPMERNVRSYDQAIQQMKDCITNRIAHMDGSLDRLYVICHDSMNKTYRYGEEGELG